MKCPNCLTEHGVENVCFVGLLLSVVSDRRGEVTPAEVELVFATVDPDYLWNRFGGPAADYIEDMLPAEEG